MKILTFDIEDWFHVLDNPETSSVDSWKEFTPRIHSGVEHILCILEQKSVKATFFVLGWVAEKYPEIVTLIANGGHEIASHSYSHQLVYKLSPEEFKEDTYRSKVILEDVSGQSINAYRAPGFSITSQNLWAFEVISNLGFDVDCSVFPATRAHGGMPNFSTCMPSISRNFEKELKFFPINSRSFMAKSFIYSGGGYFRMIPKWILNKWFAQDEYIMTYFHPRDFDKNQPMIPGLNLVRKFKSYVGINGATSKLTSILDRNKFVTLEEAVTQVDWQKAPQVDCSQL